MKDFEGIMSEKDCFDNISRSDAFDALWVLASRLAPEQMDAWKRNSEIPVLRDGDGKLIAEIMRLQKIILEYGLEILIERQPNY